MATRHVNVQSIQNRSAWPRPGRKPYVVRWTVGGHNKTRAFLRRTAADRYRGRLLAAAGDGDLFDTATGEPLSWATKAPPTSGELTFVEYVATHTDNKWPEWKPKSRSSAVEGLIIAAYTLTDEPLPKAMVLTARAYLRKVVLNPPLRQDDGIIELTADAAQAARWLAEHSLPMGEIRAKDVAATHLVLDAAMVDHGRPFRGHWT